MAAEKRGKKPATASEGANPPPEPASPVSVPESSDDSPPVSADKDASESEAGRLELCVAGLVASAGGLDAFKKFFAVMPADSGIAFVLIPHLDPTHASLMVELLGRRTSMPVVEAAEGMAVEANRVYIIPPNKNMTLAGGELRLTGPVERRSWQTSIDLFLHSLADDRLEKAIGIILSGTGSHGTLGLKAVKAAGGMVIVQDSNTAEYPGMPASAIATGLADYVLPVEQMPEVLVKYVQHFSVNGGGVVAAIDGAPDQLNQLLALLRTRTKVDFRGYRKKMLTRRLERRMGLTQFANVADYLAHLHDHPDEVKQLAHDLLISVTRFFRDPDAFRTLETEVIAPLIQAKDADAPLRVWVPGCATGEEPYSIAMLLLELQSVAQNPCRLQIFATDVDEPALEVARHGLYPADISADVSPERLARFFTRGDESTWQVSKQVRETVTFAQQNLIADAPFSRLDMISCRNFLIYLEPEVQRKVLAHFHFALKAGGYLFLGPSETLGRQTDLFEPVCKKWRIYRRIGPSRAGDLQFPVMQSEPRQATPQFASRPQAPPKLAKLAQDSLLRRFGLACVVINRNYEVLHFAGPTENYLVQPSGPPTQNLLSLARQGLEAKLRVVIRRATHENALQTTKDVKLRHGDDIRRVNIAAEPLNLSRQTEGLLLISFQEQSNSSEETLAEAQTRADTAESDLLHQLEQELETTRDDLRSTIEEWESANEELKVSNEEVMSMNEEIQSANEELESSKEELQSFNEELRTVNNQLHDKIEEVESTTNDMANLLDTTEIATVFLDPGLRIKLFTPASTRLFKLIATDRGRSIGDIANRFTDGDLLREAQQLLRDLTPREKEVSTEDGRWYVRRIVPYQTLDNRIDGVVITFVDITERKQAADASVRHLAAVVESSADAIFSKDLDGTIRTWNRGAERLYGYGHDEVVGRSVKMLVPEDRTDEWARIMAMLERGEHVEQFETERLRKDGQRVVMELTISPMRDSKGRVMSASVTGRDITDRKRVQNQLRDSEARYRTLFSTMLEGFCIIEVVFDTRGKPVDYRFLEINPAFEKQTGLQDAQGRLIRDLAPDLEEHWFEIFGKIALTGEPARFVNEARALNRWFEVSAFRLGGTDSRKVAVVFNDITESKRAEQALRQSERRERERAAELAAILDAVPTPVLIAHDPDCLHITGNRAADVLLRNPRGAEASLTASAATRPNHFRAVKDGRDLPNEELPCQRAARGVPVQDFEFSLLFDDGTTREMLAYATPLADDENQLRGAINVLVDITERKRAVESLRDREARIAAILSTAADAIITIDGRGAIQSVNVATERMFGYPAAELIGQNVKILMPAPYRDEHDRYLARYQQTGEKNIIGIGREAAGRRKDGSTFPVDLAVSEVEGLKLFTGILRDVSRRKELEREVVEIASLSQRRIGQDLHDSVSQELTALSMLAGDLAETLGTGPSDGSKLVERLVLGLQRSQQELRAVMRGLCPVSVDAQGLMAALSDLATRTRQEGKVSCAFDCSRPVLVEDNLIATHLYLIAQEAVHNAIRHARCQNIRIAVQSNDVLRLRVQDDGIGISDQPTEDHGGLGLRIMHNRAAIIRATLTIEPAKPAGTLVTCALARKNHEP
jgi:two-component system CheB/CheR fusion protein